MKNVYSVFSYSPSSVGFAQLAATKQKQGASLNGNGLDANHGGAIGE